MRTRAGWWARSPAASASAHFFHARLARPLGPRARLSLSRLRLRAGVGAEGEGALGALASRSLFHPPGARPLGACAGQREARVAGSGALAPVSRWVGPPAGPPPPRSPGEARWSPPPGSPDGGEAATAAAEKPSRSVSGPGARFPAEAMGDPAPARSLDDIDLSALRVSAPPPSLALVPVPAAGERAPARLARSPGALSPAATPAPLPRARRSRRRRAPALCSPRLSTRCRFWELVRSPPWGAPPPHFPPPLPLLRFRTPFSQVLEGHPLAPLNL